MNKIDRSNRFKLHAYFGIASICLPFVASMVAVAVSGSRGYAGLGPFMSLPIIQLVYSFPFLHLKQFLISHRSPLIASVTPCVS